MLFDDSYLTIEASAAGEFNDRGSKFLSYAFPITSHTEVKEILSRLKGEHPKAVHHCWALRLSTDRSVFKLNDDGEPSGTAGRPILNVLLSRDVTNILVVVVRYFGGTLLGVPGLINAYKQATTAALGNARIIEQTLQDIYTVSFRYEQMNDIMRLVKEHHLTILQQEVDAICSLQISIRQTQVNQLLSRIEKLNGFKATYDRTV